MDFLDANKKRKHRIRLFTGYGLMAILIMLGATILLFEASGYDVDRRTGELIHNGLVFVDAQPEPAKVYLDGKYKGQTDMRLVIPEGEYHLELRREGYRTWKQAFELEGSRIERFVYPFLFPKELKPADVQLYAKQPDLATQSPDRRWLLIQRPGSMTEFEVTDLRSKNANTKTITLPAALFTKADGARRLETIEWSSDNRHVLMKHVYKGGEDYILVDHEAPTKSISLNTIFKERFTDVTLRDKQPDKFYLFNKPDGILSRADRESGIATPFLQNVLAYNSHGSNTVLYTAAKDAKDGNVSVFLRDDDQEYKIRELPIDNKYLLNMARYDGVWYTAMGTKKGKSVYVYADAVNDIRRYEEILRIPVPVVILRADNPEYLTMSANARFIALQGGSRVSVYDAETEELHRYSFIPKAEPKQKLTWMDGHRLTTVVDGKIMVMDFDGTNRQELVVADKNFQPYFDRDYKVMYTVGPSVVVPGRSSLSRTPLTVPNE